MGVCTYTLLCMYCMNVYVCLNMYIYICFRMSLYAHYCVFKCMCSVCVWRWSALVCLVCYCVIVMRDLCERVFNVHVMCNVCCWMCIFSLHAFNVYYCMCGLERTW